MDSSEPKADGFNRLRSMVLRATLEGGNPRPIRERGYYRAIKRGEQWALLEQRMRESRETLNRALMGLYSGNLELFYATLFLRNLLNKVIIDK